MILGVVLGMGLAILLFKFVPTALYDLILSVKNDCQKNANVPALLAGFAAKVATI